MGCPPRIARFTIFIDLNKLQPAGYHTRRIAILLPNGMVNHQQDARLNTGVGRIYQHSTLFELCPMLFESEVQYRMHQRVPRMDEVRHCMAPRSDLVFLKADPLVLVENRRPRLSNDSVALTDNGRDMADFIAPRLTRTQLSTEFSERLIKKTSE